MLATILLGLALSQCPNGQCQRPTALPGPQMPAPAIAAPAPSIRYYVAPERPRAVLWPRRRRHR